MRPREMDSSALAIAVSTRRRLLLLALGSAAIGMTPRVKAAARTTPAVAAVDPKPMRLDATQSQRFRSWMTLLVHAQLDRGPTPRWTHRDCAGLVRFAVGEALREHDLAWRRASGLIATRLPNDVEPRDAQPLRHVWRRADGSSGAYVGALELIQQNSRFVSRQLAQAAPGDLLFFDFGDEQHLMVWMGAYLAYHTGHVEPGDNGLRALRPAQLFAWADTRWRPNGDNPNFAGVHRLAFLA